MSSIPADGRSVHADSHRLAGSPQVRTMMPVNRKAEARIPKLGGTRDTGFQGACLHATA
jgi:hypothetical protein